MSPRGTAGIDSLIYSPDDYRVSQAFGSAFRDEGHEGLRYDSVRKDGGTCFATFRPAAIETVGDEAKHLGLDWDGAGIQSYAVVTTHQLPRPSP